MSEDKNKWCWTRIGEASQKNNNNTYKCLSEILQVLLESFLVFIVFIFENLIGVAFLLLGIIFINDCPVKNSIPYSLITFGAFSLTHSIIIQVFRSKLINFSDEKDGFATLAKLIVLICSLGTLVAFIWACFAIYGVFSEVTTHWHNSANYCNYYLYWISFTIITICLVLCLIFLIIFCCLCCSVIVGGAAVSDLRPMFVIINKEPRS